MNVTSRHILITGPPGVGKTTLVRRLCDEMRKKFGDTCLSGFYTQEVRSAQSGQRTGFELVAIPSGEKARLAQAYFNVAAYAQVGKYSVLVEEFEPLALKTLNSCGTSPIFVVDEIGKMECVSETFCREVVQLFDGKRCVLATIPNVARISVVEKIKQRNDVKIFHVSKENREALFAELFELLETMLTQ